MAELVVTAARDALHRQDPARPAVSPVFSGGGRYASPVVNGTPGRTVCGQVPAVGVNELAARQLYPGLAPCPACA